MSELSVIGLNHRTAPVAVRETLALPSDLALALLRRAHAEAVLEEALVLSTCNRTEFYVVAGGSQDPLAYLLDGVAALGGRPISIDRNLFYRHTATDAVRHLFRVAASLDSQIVGEHQILGQVKTAYHLAVEARTARFLLNKLLHAAMRVGKRVLTETEIGRGSAGIAQAAVELAGRLFESLRGRTVLLIGAGANAECAARAVLRAGAVRLIVANRTLARAQSLAHDLLTRPPEKPCDLDDDAVAPAACPTLAPQGAAAPATAAPPSAVAAEAVDLDGLPDALATADLVIASTGSPDPVLRYDALADRLRRRDRTLLLIDIAVPRDIDERLATLPNVFLYNIDDLDRLVARNRARREQEVPRAERIVAAEVEAFDRWLASRQAAPTIRLLHRRIETIQADHLRRYGGRFSEADRAQLQAFTESLGRKVLHDPTAYLSDLAKDGALSDGLELLDLVHRLFDLDALGEETSGGSSS